MRNIFALDSPIMRVLSRIFDLIVLNLLFIVMCLPVITIGANIAAMSYVLVQMVRGRDAYPVKTYFEVFKSSFRKATLLWIPLALAGLFLCMDFWMMDAMERAGSLPGFIRIFTLALFLLYSMVMQFALPLMAYPGGSKVGESLKRAFYLAMKYLPFTLIMVVITVLPSAIVLLWRLDWLYCYMWIMGLIGFAGSGFLQAFFLNQVWKKELDF